MIFLIPIFILPLYFPSFAVDAKSVTGSNNKSEKQIQSHFSQLGLIAWSKDKKENKKTSLEIEGQKMNNSITFTWIFTHWRTKTFLFTFSLSLFLSLEIYSSLFGCGKQ